MSFACEEFVFSLEDIEDYIGTKIPVDSVEKSRTRSRSAGKTEHRGFEKEGWFFEKKSQSGLRRNYNNRLF